MRPQVFLRFALVVLVHGVGATEPQQAVQEQVPAQVETPSLQCNCSYRNATHRLISPHRAGAGTGARREVLVVDGAVRCHTKLGA